MLFNRLTRTRCNISARRAHSYQTSKVFNLGRTALWRWKKQFEEQGDLEDKPRRKYFKKIDPQKLEEYLDAHPDAYLYEIGMVFSLFICRCLEGA